jgi:Ser/Thr protein kinase RdoA (MazF antagonist)
MDDWQDALDRAAQVNEADRPVVIDGGRVTRPAAANAATIHDFLRHLRAEGVEAVPEPLGIDGDRETLRLIQGDSGGDGWYHQHSDAGLASAARLLRRIHDASRSWRPPAGATWGAPAGDTPPGEDQVFCHGDPGPWNFVWLDGSAVGLVDWDYLHPGPRLDDVAYALQWFAPLRSDELATGWHHFPEVPDRRHRVEVFLEAYGDLPEFDVADAVSARMQAVSDLVRALAEAGQEPQRTWVAEGALEQDAVEIAWVRENRAVFS